MPLEAWKPVRAKGIYNQTPKRPCSYWYRTCGEPSTVQPTKSKAPRKQRSEQCRSDVSSALTTRKTDSMTLRGGLAQTSAAPSAKHGGTAHASTAKSIVAAAEVEEADRGDEGGENDA
eukprot:1343472-Rhodomonas_salina.3